jgi:hypothetical protein
VGKTRTIETGGKDEMLAIFSAAISTLIFNCVQEKETPKPQIATPAPRFSIGIHPTMDQSNSST